MNATHTATINGSSASTPDDVVDHAHLRASALDIPQRERGERT